MYNVSKKTLICQINYSILHIFKVEDDCNYKYIHTRTSKKMYTYILAVIFELVYNDRV